MSKAPPQSEISEAVSSVSQSSVHLSAVSFGKVRPKIAKSDAETLV